MSAQTKELNFNNLTREEAIEIVGLNLVEAVEDEPCEFVSIDNSGTQEWVSCRIIYTKKDYDMIMAHYFINVEGTQGEKDYMDNGEWNISYYSVSRW